jgi:hypothetical protein
MALFKRQRKKAGKAETDPGVPESTTDGASADLKAPSVVEAPVMEQPDAQAPEPVAAEEAAVGPVNETLPLALEPELRKIIDTAVARVATIELEAIRESRQLTQRSEEESREVLKFALDKSQQLVNSFELLTVTVAGMVSALRVEIDAATAALHQVDDPYARLPRELDTKQAAPDALPPVESPQAVEDTGTSILEADGAAPEAVQATNGDRPEIHAGPNPVNEIDPDDPIERAAARSAAQRGGFVRRFFSRR